MIRRAVAWCVVSLAPLGAQEPPPRPALPTLPASVHVVLVVSVSPGNGR